MRGIMVMQTSEIQIWILAFHTVCFDTLVSGCYGSNSNRHSTANKDDVMATTTTATATPPSHRQSSKRRRSTGNHSPSSSGRRRESSDNSVRIMFTGINPTQRHKQMIDDIGAKLVDSVEEASTATRK